MNNEMILNISKQLSERLDFRNVEFVEEVANGDLHFRANDTMGTPERIKVKPQTKTVFTNNFGNWVQVKGVILV